MEKDNKVTPDRVSYVNDSSGFHGSSKQIEVSHGSISNQPSIYQSQVISEHHTGSCWCVMTCTVAMVLSLLFLLLVLFDVIPGLTRHFQIHRSDKKVTVAFTSTLVIVLLVVVTFGCARRFKCFHWIHQKFSRRNLFYDHFDDSDNRNKIATNPKLTELGEEMLKDIERIFKKFSDSHDNNDWLFSPFSASTTSLKGFSGNTLFQQVEHSVKLKFSIKVILAGPPNVGKTSIFHRILYDRFSEYYMATLGADLAHMSLHLFPGQPENHVLISLQLWDIAGSENFRDVQHVVYKDAALFIIVCDVTQSNHLKLSVPWIKDIKNLSYQPYVAMFFNKIDLQEKQQKPIDNELEELIDLDKYYVSAKTGEKVLENMLDVFVKAILHEVNKLL